MTAPERDRAVDRVFIALGLLVLWAVPHRISGDGEVRFETLERLLTRGELFVPRYSIVGPIFSTPLFLLGRAIGDPRAMTAHFNAVLFSAALVFFARELESELGAARMRVAVLLLVFASMFPNHVQVFYGEVFTALAVAAGVFLLSRAERTRTTLGAWALIVVGAANTPASVVGVAIIALRAALRTRKLSHLAAPVFVLALAFAENLVTRGAPFRTGYEGDVGFRTALPFSGLPGFSFPLFFGLLAVLFSFGKGLVFFTPGLFVPLAKDASERLRWVHGSLVGFVVGLVLVYAKWWAWSGNWFWGPRFFLAASIVAAITIASHASPSSVPRAPWKDAAFAGILALSFWVGVNGLVFDTTGLGLCVENACALEMLCNFTPEFSVLWHPLVDFASTVPEKTRPVAIAVCVFWAVVFVWTARVPLVGALGAARDSVIAMVTRLLKPRS